MTTEPSVARVTYNLGHARNVAHSLDRDLDRVHALAAARDLDLLRDVARGLARDLGRLHDLSHGFSDDIDSADNIEFLRRVHNNADIAGELDCTLSPHRTMDSGLFIALFGSFDAVRGLVRASSRARIRAHRLAGLLDQVRWEVRQLVEERELPAPPASGTDVLRRPARVARWTAGWAVWILPAVHRDRWREEYADELTELAAQGWTRRQQLDYGLQVLFNAISLRRALREAAVHPVQER